MTTSTSQPIAPTTSAPPPSSSGTPAAPATPGSVPAAAVTGNGTAQIPSAPPSPVKQPTPRVRLWLRWARFLSSTLFGGGIVLAGVRLQQGLQPPPAESAIVSIVSASAPTIILLGALIMSGALLALILSLARVPWLNIALAVANFFLGLYAFGAMFLLGSLLGVAGTPLALLVGLFFVLAYLGSLVNLIVTF